MTQSAGSQISGCLSSVGAEAVLGYVFGMDWGRVHESNVGAIYRYPSVFLRIYNVDVGEQ